LITKLIIVLLPFGSVALSGDVAARLIKKGALLNAVHSNIQPNFEITCPVRINLICGLT